MTGMAKDLAEGWRLGTYGAMYICHECQFCLFPHILVLHKGRKFDQQESFDPPLERAHFQWHMSLVLGKEEHEEEPF